MNGLVTEQGREGPRAFKFLELGYGYAYTPFMIICLAVDFGPICFLVCKLCSYNKNVLNISICKKTNRDDGYLDQGSEKGRRIRQNQ